MSPVETSEARSESDNGKAVHDVPLLCECEDETLSLAQQMWTERQSKIRIALSNMMRCLVDAGARVARWQIAFNQDVEVYLWDEEKNIDLRLVNPSLYKLLTHQVNSENTSVPYIPPWSNLIDAAIEIATPVPLRSESQAKIQRRTQELIVPEPNGPETHTTNSPMLVSDVEGEVQLTSSKRTVPTSIRSSPVSKRRPGENLKVGKASYSMVTQTPSGSRERTMDPNQQNSGLLTPSSKTKMYTPGTRKILQTGTHFQNLHVEKRLRMSIVDHGTLKTLVSYGRSPFLQARIPGLLPIAPRPSTIARPSSNVRMLQIMHGTNRQKTQPVTVSTQADRHMQLSNDNSEEIPLKTISSRSSGSETDEADILDEYDEKELNFKFLGAGKIFPSLAVVVRPQLRSKERARSLKLQDKTALGNAVNLLVSDQSKLMEWLIQKKLVPSSQVCDTSRSKYGKHILRLARCSDVTKFPCSGGYIWFCELCQPSQIVPVIRGSIFEGNYNSSPGELLKLILHWASFSGLHTFKEEMELRMKEGKRLRDLYKLLRAVCTATLQRQVQIGGEDCRVEIGIVSLGTVDRVDTERKIKIEILGIIDLENKQVRLQSVKPLQEGEKNSKARFAKILEPLPRWLHKGSLIVTDYSVDTDALRKLGYKNIKQIACNADDSNVHIMNYLRNVIPVIFQHTLSLFSQPMIQQFLDELVWREHWGWHPSLAYNNILQHIAFLTQKYSGKNFVKNLREIAANPFKEWIQVEFRNITRDSLNAQNQPSVLETLSRTNGKSQDFSTSNSKSAGPLLSIQTVNNIDFLNNASEHHPKTISTVMESQSCAGCSSSRPAKRKNEVFCTSDLSSPLLLESSNLVTSPIPKKACLSLLKRPLKTYLSKVSKRQTILESNILHQTCIECDSTISEGHFTPTTRRCLRCKFSSHCRSASGLHFAVAHNPIPQDLKKPSRRSRRGLRKVRPMIGDPRTRKDLPSTSGHCPCGYQSDDGDHLAGHLVSCNYSTIYIRDPPTVTKAF